jgi:VWFA-related protein
MVHFILALSLAAFVAVPDGQQPPQQKGGPGTRDVYVSVLDAKGAPVTGLTAGEFAVREDGAPREVLKAGPATAPMQIMVLIDDSQAADSATQPLREGLTAFVEALQGHAEIGLITLGERPTSIAERTTDVGVLKKAIGRVFPRPGSGTYLLDGIVDVSRGFQKREAERPVIVVVVMEGVEFSNPQYKTVLDQLYASRATLNVVSVGSPAASTEDEMRNRNMVIAEGTQQTGGRRDQVFVPMGIPDKLKQVADELLHQTVVTYARPDTLIPPEKVQVTVTRPGLTVRARTRAAGK